MCNTNNALILWMKDFRAEIIPWNQKKVPDQLLVCKIEDLKNIIVALIFKNLYKIRNLHKRVTKIVPF